MPSPSPLLHRHSAAKPAVKRRVAFGVYSVILLLTLGLCLGGVIVAFNWKPGVAHLKIDTRLADSADSRGVHDTKRISGLQGSSRWQESLEGHGLSHQDLVVALPTHKAAEAQLFAGRSGRLGLRTVVITNYTESHSERYLDAPNEIWTFYPDSKPVRSFYAGDARAAVAPFIAFRVLGDTFKWLFYGDDDTVMFVDAAMRLASSLDPQLPYFVTDNLWWSPSFGHAWHPHPQAPRCLPCGSGNVKNASAAVSIGLAVGCPCTPETMCALKGGYNNTFKGQGCGIPRSPVRTYSMHGGAGALVSIGLLRQVDWHTMERCVNHQWSSGGDSFISQCLWEQGFATTSPDPTWHPAGLQMFDPSPPGPNPDDFILWKASHVLGNLLQRAAGVCTGLCKLELDNTVTIHLRSRRVGKSDAQAAAFIAAFSRFYSRLRGAFGHEDMELLSDIPDQPTAAVLAAIDDSLKAGISAVKELVRLQTATLGARDLHVSTKFGRLSAKDATKAGVADAIATRLLTNMADLVGNITDEPASEKQPQRSDILAWLFQG